MRKTVAAACVAILVGLAQPGPVSCASVWLAGFIADAACESVSASTRSVHSTCSRSSGSQGTSSSAGRSLRAPARSLVSSAPAPLPLRIWRAPSGPAPSQAPPFFS